MPGHEQLLFPHADSLGNSCSSETCLRTCEPRRKAGTGGFTLLELLVVLVILAAVAMLVVSKVDAFGENAEDTVARANLNAVREAILGSAAAPGYLADMKHVPGFDRTNLKMHHLLAESVDEFLPEQIEQFSVLTGRGWRGPYLERTPRVANTNSGRDGQFPHPLERRFADDATFLARGFYDTLTHSYYGEHDPDPGENDRAMGDPWGNPIVIQVPLSTAFNAPSDTKRFQYARLVSAGPDGLLTTPLDHALADLQPDGTSPRRGDDLVLFLNRADVYETAP